MRVQPIGPRQINFKDDDTYFPTEYWPADSILKLKRNGYIIQGETNVDAFDRLHEDINADLKKVANSRSGVWYMDWVNGRKFNDRSVKYAVHEWGMSKQKFTKLLTSFWEVNKNNTFKNVDKSIANYLENYEGLKRPSFFTRLINFMTPLEYSVKESILDIITNNFLKNGQHRLK